MSSRRAVSCPYQKESVSWRFPTTATLDRNSAHLFLGRARDRELDRLFQTLGSIGWSCRRRGQVSIDLLTVSRKRNGLAGVWHTVLSALFSFFRWFFWDGQNRTIFNRTLFSCLHLVARLQHLSLVRLLCKQVRGGRDEDVRFELCNDERKIGCIICDIIQNRTFGELCVVQD